MSAGVQQFGQVEVDPACRAAFEAVGAAVYRGDPLAAAAAQRPPWETLGHLTQRGGDWRAFLDPRGARAVAMLPAGAGEVGLVGFFEARDEDAARAVLDAACALLATRGAARALGPMDGSTWHRYRFVTDGATDAPFLLEPYHPPGYPALFEAAGFRPWRVDASLVVPTGEAHIFARQEARCRAAGLSLEPLQPGEATANLPLFYELSRRVFSAAKQTFQDIGREEFEALYRTLDQVIAPDLSFVARGPGRAGAPLGFLFAYPDRLETLRTNAPPTATVVKTVAVLPEAAARLGLGYALTSAHLRAARAQGYTRAIYALMERWESTLRVIADPRRMRGSGPGEVLRRYTLYARALA